MVHALETEPELFIRTQQFLPFFKELKEASTPLTYKKTKKQNKNKKMRTVS